MAESGNAVARAGALGSLVVLTGAVVSVLLEITGVVGGTTELLAVVVVALVGALVVARVVGVALATGIATIASMVGFGYYLETADLGLETVGSQFDVLLWDTVALLSGLSVLRMTEAGTWVLGFAPGPVFLSWYLAFRRQYAWSALVAAGALGFLVLTGDATGPVVLVGAIAGVVTVGFGEIDRRGLSLLNADTVLVVVAVAFALALALSGISGGGLGPLGGDVEEAGTLDEAVGDGEEVSPITGSLDLSAEVRFTVESEEPAYWRTGVYDRFTGDTWVATGESEPIEGQIIEGAIGSNLEQTVIAEGELDAMPAAAQPVQIDDETAEFTTVDDHGQIRPTTTLLDGDGYTVESTVVDPTSAELQAAGTDYPASIEERYLQVPEDTSSAFEDRTAEVTDDAETPYETATAIESYLREEYDYSLDIDLPDGNVAEAFLLEMDEGYCVYFATTMVQMLRAEEIPARYVTGYTSGESVGDDEWEVRGLDAHAWVEVYVPDHGWVEFEPTPPARDVVHEEVREAGGDDDTRDDNDPMNDTDDESGNQTDPTGNESTADDDDLNVSIDDALGGDDEDDDESVILTPTVLAALAVMMVGFVAGARRHGLGGTVLTALTLRWQRPAGTPSKDVTRAYGRLETLLSRTHRPREPSETVGEYLTDLELESGTAEAVESIGVAYERVRYGPGVDRETAVATVARVDDLVEQSVRGPVGENASRVGRTSR